MEKPSPFEDDAPPSKDAVDREEKDGPVVVEGGHNDRDSMAKDDDDDQQAPEDQATEMTDEELALRWQYMADVSVSRRFVFSLRSTPCHLCPPSHQFLLEDWNALGKCAMPW